MGISWLEVGDLHLSLHDNYGVYLPDVGYNSRLADKLQILNSVADFAIDKSVQFVVFLGDIYDSVNPEDKLRCEFAKIVERLISNDISVFIVVGNHETDGISTAFDDMHFLFSSGSESLVTICRDVRLYKMKTDSETIGFCFVPWFGGENGFNAVERFFEEKSIDFDDFDKLVLFAHAYVEGASVGGMRVLKKFSFSKSDLKKFDRVSLGHVHLRQKYYVGSLTTNNFKDCDGEHGFEYVSLKNGNIISEFIPVVDKKFVKLTLDEKNNEVNFSDFENCIARVTFVGSKTFLESINIFEFKKKFPDSAIVTVRRELADFFANDNETIGTVVQFKEKLLSVAKTRGWDKPVIDKVFSVLKHIEEADHAD